jgi:peptidyl-prolyl cis-trans isomerase C
LLLALALVGCSGPPALVAAAQVNGQAIALQDYLRFVQSNEGLCEFQSELNQSITAQIDWNAPARRDDLAAVRRTSLNELINVELTSEQAAARHIQPPSDQQVEQLLAVSQQAGAFPPSDLWASLHINRDDLLLLARQALEQQALLQLMPDLKVEEAHVARITVNDKATAEQVLAQLHAGAGFDALAAKYSQDATRGTGGDAGYFTPGSDVPALDHVYFHAPIGQPVGPIVVTQPADRLCFASTPGVEPPVHTQQGPAVYYIVQVLERQSVSLFDVPNSPNSAQDVAFATWLRQHANIQVQVDY